MHIWDKLIGAWESTKMLFWSSNVNLNSISEPIKEWHRNKLFLNGEWMMCDAPVRLKYTRRIIAPNFWYTVLPVVLQKNVDSVVKVNQLNIFTQYVMEFLYLIDTYRWGRKFVSVRASGWWTYTLHHCQFPKNPWK